MPTRLRRLIEILGLVCFAGCVTPRAPQPMPKEPCYCGWLQGANAAAPKACAAWQKIWTSPDRQPVLASAPSPRCDIQACGKLFERTACGPFELWPELPTPTATSQETGCFCDFVAVQGHAGGEIACGVWKTGDRYLREYYFTKECDAKTCANKPFRDSVALCGGQYRKFFESGELLPQP